MLRKSFAFVLALIFVFSAVFSPATALMPTAKAAVQPVEQHGQLNVSGSQLLNENGQTVQLKGMSSHGLQWYGHFVNYDSIKWLRDDWGITVFRASMYTDPEADGYIADPSLKEKVKEAVEAAIDLGIYVIIDWHILYDNDPNMYKEEAKAFFQEMAQLYGDHPNVIYEICNEPNGNVTWDQHIKPYAEEVIPVIRSVDPDNPIIVGTATWSQDVHEAAANPLDFNNILYAAHFYAGTHGQWLRDRIDNAMNQGIAIFVSEWGTSAASGDGGVFLNEAQEWVDFMESRNISWANWSLADKDESSAALLPGASPTGGWPDSQLSESGRFVKSQMDDPPTDTEPRTPSGLTADAGDGHVDLSWNAADGAEQYTVKRATTSGGPYSAIANVTSTNYTDNSVTNGETYYYVVSAVNSAGESGNSNQVSATPQSSNNGGGGDGDLSVQYRAADTDPGNNQIKPHIKIVNHGDHSVSMDELTVRYWFTNEEGKAQNVFCDYAVVNCSNVNGQFVRLSESGNGADTYLEVSFGSGAGSLAPGEDSGEIQLRIHHADWSNYDESNDYSFDGSKQNYAEWDRITLYQNGQLVWGIEP